MKLNHTKHSNFIPAITNGRQLVIPDIHGCLATFKALLKQIKLTKNDQLFLLGDYINKGKNSKGVLDLIIELQKNQEENGYQIFPLRGNHEQMFIEDYEGIKTNQFLDKTADFSELEYNFASKLPYFYELDNFFLVHAGFNLEHGNPFLDFDAMLWKRDFAITNKEKVNNFYNKTIIIGHNPTFLDYILQDINLKTPSLCLDNGCVYHKKWFLGNLLCLDLNSFEVFIQKNSEA
ncbi:putative phosphohydrolase [Bernardetia litoralis DSM 6794]|uniref:Putative phosphohydrolase n=1 Tax=Bernardetia litoralis (strain ATCC 23117 / DSM 6794 / NBRC 15988 / NCIMB 1366 / Fx l1 / Sio-4) TaxID=880071 RepID=I4AEY0_BERLS|nr:metallophosphoesterase family protein [Bernardetia litoralis]AFM02515.1 putative phosphohydrolase [Bernardetia litoralis DSM 6794]